MTKLSKPVKPREVKKKRGHWAQCFLEHAARETSWAKDAAKQCDYARAHDALTRRSVWLYAALLAQERNK